MARTALRVIEHPRFEVRRGEFWPTGSGASFSHSLHALHLGVSEASIGVAQYFIKSYSKRGEIILDPFCATGGVGLEAALQGRISYQSGIDNLALRTARARVRPADISEVSIWLHRQSLKRPISVETFRRKFSEFFDLDTFRELAALREALGIDGSRVARFVEAIVLNILHGHSAGCLSVYTFPQVSLSVDEQRSLNRRHGFSPEYRAVVPRILRRSAQVLRDGIPSVLSSSAGLHVVECCDCRALDYVPPQSVALVVTSPPLPRPVSAGYHDFSEHQWLRHWFAGSANTSAAQDKVKSVDDWLGLMNEGLVEMARVVRPGGRAVFSFVTDAKSNPGYSLEPWPERLRLMVDEELSRYWDSECLYVQALRVPQIKSRATARKMENGTQATHALVLRRR